MAKSKKLSILEKYMHFILENGKRPATVYQFCQLNGITEKEFYSQYASFESVERMVFETFFTQTITLLNKNKEYQDYEAREKLLSFYFTFIAMLTENRTYVMQVLEMEKDHGKKLKQFKLLRKHFKNFVSEISDDIGGLGLKNFERVKAFTFEEGSWLQFMMILKFWMEDESAGFSKTDIFIEKSVKASFDLINTAPLQSVIDFGKFLFKEKMS